MKFISFDDELILPAQEVVLKVNSTTNKIEVYQVRDLKNKIFLIPIVDMQPTKLRRQLANILNNTYTIAE